MSNQDRERAYQAYCVIQPHAIPQDFDAGWQAALSAGQATEPVACSVQLQLDDAILAQGEIGRLKTVVREHEETIRQLVRALREATEGETFMGEPVLRAAGLVIPEPPTVTDEMVTRFLSWKLPANFNPDCGITFKREYNEHMSWGPNIHEPVGTNLLDAEQARAMLEHVLAAPALGDQG